jgi:hypothetical protein
MTTVHAFCADREAYLVNVYRDVHVWQEECGVDHYGGPQKAHWCLGWVDLCAADPQCLQAAVEAASNWCGQCWTATTDIVDMSVSWEDVTYANINAMHIFDILTLLLCTTIVAMAVVAELRDCALCRMAAIAQTAGTGAKPLSAAWSYALDLLYYLRRAMFLPSLVGNVGFLIIFKGGNAISVCFNSVRSFVEACKLRCMHDCT